MSLCRIYCLVRILPDIVPCSETYKGAYFTQYAMLSVCIRDLLCCIARYQITLHGSPFILLYVFSTMVF